MMRIIDNQGRLFGKVNIIDLLIVAVIVGVMAILITTRRGINILSPLESAQRILLNDYYAKLGTLEDANREKNNLLILRDEEIIRLKQKITQIIETNEQKIKELIGVEEQFFQEHPRARRYFKR